MVTHRKTTTDTAASQYTPCEHCFAYVLKRDLWLHKCSSGKTSKGRVLHNSQLLIPATKALVGLAYELISAMRDDEVKKVIQNDSLIIAYTNKLIHWKEMQRKSYIRDKVREIARFLIQIKKHNSQLNLKDCIAPEQFENCLAAVRELAGFDSGSATYKTPSLALKIGHALKKTGKNIEATGSGRETL